MTTTVRLGGGHCCACSGMCHHVGPARFCADHAGQAAATSRPVVVPLPPRPPLRPCPAEVEAVLGFAEPTTIPCGLEAGHEGRHRYLIEWAESGLATEGNTP